jgi:hypothetical protein
MQTCRIFTSRLHRGRRPEHGTSSRWSWMQMYFRYAWMQTKLCDRLRGAALSESVSSSTPLSFRACWIAAIGDSRLRFTPCMYCKSGPGPRTAENRRNLRKVVSCADFLNRPAGVFRLDKVASPLDLKSTPANDITILRHSLTGFTTCLSP